jgi:hypothetical protein
MQIKVIHFDDTDKILKESDILPDLAGQGGKILSVKSDGSKLETIDPPSGGGGVGESLYFYSNYPGGL